MTFPRLTNQSRQVTTVSLILDTEEASFAEQIKCGHDGLEEAEEVLVRECVTTEQHMIKIK